MKRISTVIIGAGQAGLAMSRCLSDSSVAHVVIERGEVANSWRNDRWDSLRLLTPNWQSRLPGFSYRGDDPDGFMDMAGVVDLLDTYASICAAPVETRTTVLSVRAEGQGYRVATNRGDWLCDTVVLANGACHRAHIPDFAEALPVEIEQLTPLTYRNPGQLADGGVLVVGASASGVQLAAEIRAAGHEVTVAAGHHIRMPRFYRGRDIQWWMDRAGILNMGLDAIDDIVRARRVPSLQLVGDSSARFLDLNALQAMGIEVTGRLAGIRDGTALFSGGLANAAALSDLKMNRLLAELDTWASETGLGAASGPERFEPAALPVSPRLGLDLSDGRIRTVIWATGFAPDYSWLDLPVFDRKGQLMHDAGRVAPGLYALGLPFLRRRNSALLDGVGADAAAHADHIVRNARRHAA